MDLNELNAFFDPRDISWRVGATSGSGNQRSGLALPYVDARAIMDRLDEVCGKENWFTEFRPAVNTPHRDAVECIIHIRIDGEWVGKSDVSENTDREPIKGGYSKALVRAGVMWGIGRYLYSLPAIWVPVDSNGRFQHTPKIPAEFVPGGTAALEATTLEPAAIDTALASVAGEDAIRMIQLLRAETEKETNARRKQALIARLEHYAQVVAKRIAAVELVLLSINEGADPADARAEVNDYDRWSEQWKAYMDNKLKP